MIESEFIEQFEQDYEKVKSVVLSCDSLEQLEIARKMSDNLYRMYNTIGRKFGRGGVVTDLPAYCVAKEVKLLDASIAQ